MKSAQEVLDRVEPGQVPQWDSLTSARAQLHRSVRSARERIPALVSAREGTSQVLTNATFPVMRPPVMCTTCNILKTDMFDSFSCDL